MKAVLLSVPPKGCEKIANGKQTFEMRGSYPKDLVENFFDFEPFKVYIYCTRQKTPGEIILAKSEENAKLFGYNSVVGINKGFRKEEDILLSGKVIGEFICDRMPIFRYDEHVGYPTPSYEGDPSFCDCGEGYWITGVELNQAQMTYDELIAYGNKKTLYGWHISDLVIYDTPKALEDFESYNARPYHDNEIGYPVPTHKIEKAPQSWMYVRN